MIFLTSGDHGADDAADSVVVPLVKVAFFHNWAGQEKGDIAFSMKDDAMVVWAPGDLMTFTNLGLLELLATGTDLLENGFLAFPNQEIPRAATSDNSRDAAMDGAEGSLHVEKPIEVIPILGLTRIRQPCTSLWLFWPIDNINDSIL